MTMKPIIGITMGDPTGIGPEIIIKSLSCPVIIKMCRPIVFGDEGILSTTIKNSPFKKAIQKIVEPEKCDSTLDTIYLVGLSKLNKEDIVYGKFNKVASKAMVDYIKEAANYCLNNKIDAIVTAPINKHAMNKAGFLYPGHTELLAEMTSAKDYAMMFYSKRLKVVLVTTHSPLSGVPNQIKKEKIFRIINIVYEDFRKYFGIKGPRIAVAGLNPHAGEDGILGSEERLEIAPAILSAKRDGINVEGPISPDTLFYFALKRKYDVVISMYHDQGLIPVKMLDFDNAVNVTLGLPIIRTSVDHGTAYDIAGKGIANPTSMIEAIKLAVKMVKGKKKSEKVIR